MSVIPASLFLAIAGVRFLPARATSMMMASLLVLMVCTQVPVARAQSLNPLESDPRAARAGESLFRAQCATCHGADARGIQNLNAPDLTQVWSVPGRSDSSVFGVIRNGIPGSIMPAHGFTDAQIWMIVSYLRSVRVGSDADAFAGNARRGEQLFRSECADCHKVDGEGGALGPDLSRITARRSPDDLRLAIREPAVALAAGHQTVTLVTADNQRIQGTLKGEDAFSIQIMDTAQNLRGFSKASLREVIRSGESLMPGYDQSSLDDAALEDLLAYLASRRTAVN